MRAGINVCLGSDSLASVCQKRSQPAELSMFEEMRALQQAEPNLSPRNIVHFSTVRAARALGLAGKAGELVPGAYGDLVALPFAGKVARIYDTILQHKGPVGASMIAGRWAIAPKTMDARKV